MARSLLAACLAFAGIWLLASLGWALVTAAVLVFSMWREEPDWRALRARAAGMARRGAGRVKAAPRRVTAVAGMSAAVALIPAGFGLAWGAGAALMSGGFTLAGLSLLTGQGA